MPARPPKLLFEILANDGTTINDETTIGLSIFGWWLLGLHYKTYRPLTQGRPATWRLCLLVVNVAFCWFTE